jgi:phage/plasmid-associated DNA primase
LARARAFVPDEAWDANEDTLVCGNGTLQISSRILEEHRPEDYALSAVPFDTTPTWTNFLASTVPEAAPFLQEFAGYSLTVDTGYELAVWLYGPPGGGKSTFIEGLKAMLGKRAGLLGLADVQRSRFALADLPGKTLVAAAESPRTSSTPPNLSTTSSPARRSRWRGNSGTPSR